MKPVVLIVLAALVSACASQREITFRRDGSSDADLKRESYACKKDARFSYYVPRPTDGAGVAHGIALSRSGVQHDMDMGLYLDCMEANGWTLIELN